MLGYWDVSVSHANHPLLFWDIKPATSRSQTCLCRAPLPPAVHTTDPEWVNLSIILFSCALYLYNCRHSHLSLSLHIVTYKKQQKIRDEVSTSPKQNYYNVIWIQPELRIAPSLSVLSWAACIYRSMYRFSHSGPHNARHSVMWKGTWAHEWLIIEAEAGRLQYIPVQEFNAHIHIHTYCTDMSFHRAAKLHCVVKMRCCLPQITGVPYLWNNY